MSRCDGQQSLGDNVQMMGEGHQIGDQQKESIGIGDLGKQISICPMCQGKGYYEEIGKPDISNFKRISANPEQKRLLPNIGQQPYKLEQLFKAADVKVNSRLSDTAVPVTVLKPNTRFPPVHIPNSSHKKSHSTAGQVKSSPNNTKMGGVSHLVNLLPVHTKLEKQPEDVARLAAIKLNRNDWETKKSGLEDCLQLCHYNPEELEQHMNLVYRAMSSLLNNFRPQVTLFTCQAAREFFAQMRSTCRPEYDELVFSLLNRTADNNRYIRLYANDALDKMVTYIPTVHAVRPLVEKGPIHNNPLVRTATARLLTCIVALKTPNVILTHPNLRESCCKRILETATILLADSNLDTSGGSYDIIRCSAIDKVDKLCYVAEAATRSCLLNSLSWETDEAAAKKLFQRFIHEEEFESIYYAEVDETLRKKVDRAFEELTSKIGLTKDS